MITMFNGHLLINTKSIKKSFSDPSYWRNLAIKLPIAFAIGMIIGHYFK